jgi:hypothetical protein
MSPPERAKPLPGQLGGESGQGLRDTQAITRGAASVAAIMRRANPPTRSAGATCEGVQGNTPAEGVERPQLCRPRTATGPRSSPANLGYLGPAPTASTPTAFPDAGAGALPCLSSNNSNEPNATGALKPALDLTAQQKKSACALAWNVQAMASKFGLEHLGFLTLTFADHILDPRESQRRLNNLSTGVLRDRYPLGFVRVMERQKSGRIHYHLLVVLDQDVRTGVDFQAFKDRDYRTASPALRAEWAFLRRTTKAYGFGRTELMPVRSTEEGIGRYIGKYIGKHHAAREPRDKGFRLVEYSRGARTASTRFGWVTENAEQWRAKVRLFAQIAAAHYGVPVESITDLSAFFGPRWAYHHREFIYSLPVVLPDAGNSPSFRVDTSTGEILTP